MSKHQCSAPGCSSRAWHGELCNFHALEQHRTTGQGPRSAEERLREGRRLLRARAQELGIILDEPTPVAVVAGMRRKARSPSS